MDIHHPTGIKTKIIGFDSSPSRNKFKNLTISWTSPSLLVELGLLKSHSWPKIACKTTFSWLKHLKSLKFQPFLFNPSRSSNQNAGDLSGSPTFAPPPALELQCHRHHSPPWRGPHLLLLRAWKKCPHYPVLTGFISTNCWWTSCSSGGILKFWVVHMPILVRMLKVTIFRLLKSFIFLGEAPSTQRSECDPHLSESDPRMEQWTKRIALLLKNHRKTIGKWCFNGI